MSKHILESLDDEERTPFAEKAFLALLVVLVWVFTSQIGLSLVAFCLAMATLTYLGAASTANLSLWPAAFFGALALLASLRSMTRRNV